MKSSTQLTLAQIQEITQKIYISRSLYRKSSRALMRNVAAECLYACSTLGTDDTKEAEALAKAFVKLFRQKEFLCLTLPQNLCYEKTSYPTENFIFPQDFYTALTQHIDGEIIYQPQNYQAYLNQAYQSASEAHLKPMLTTVVKNNLLHYLIYQCTKLMDSIPKPDNINFENDPKLVMHQMLNHANYETFLPSFIDTILDTYQHNKNEKTTAIFEKILTLIEILFSSETRASLDNLTKNDLAESDQESKEDSPSTTNHLVAADLLKQLTIEQLFININNHRDELTTKRVATGMVFKTKPCPSKDQKLFEHLDQLVEQYNDILGIPLPDVNIMRDTSERPEMKDRSQLSEAEATQLASEAFISPVLYSAGSMLSSTRSARDIRTMVAECLFQIEQQRAYSLSDDHRRALAIEITKLIKASEISDLYLGQKCYNNVTNPDSRATNFSFPSEFFNVFAQKYIQTYNVSNSKIQYADLARNVAIAYQAAADHTLKPFIRTLVQNNLVRYLRYLAIEFIKKATPTDNRLGKAVHWATNSKFQKLIDSRKATYQENAITRKLLNEKKVDMENHTVYASFANTFIDFIDRINELNTTAASGAMGPKDKSLIQIYSKISKIIELIKAKSIEATKASAQEHLDENGHRNRYSSIASPSQHGNSYHEHNQRQSMIDLTITDDNGKSESTRDMLTTKRSFYANMPGIKKLTSSEGEELYEFLDRLLGQFDDLTQASESLLSNANRSTMHTTMDTNMDTPVNTGTSFTV